jgi:hypothetical protein
MKKLINISNHPSSSWSAEQKAGWDEIVDVPFPAVPPEWDTHQVVNLAVELAEKVGELATDLPEGEIPNVMVVGDFSLSAVLYQSMAGVWRFWFPTSERLVEETGDGRKVITFRFVRWRSL